MEDRKRPAMSGADDIGPPSKRQAVNGSSKHSKDDSDMKEEAWIEEYTKDAILRQMLEYKRKCSTLETRLEDMEQRSAYHDDHLRTVDSWWIQLLQEVSLLAETKVLFQAGDEKPFPTHTSFKDIEALQAHLDDKSAAIKTITDSLFSRLSAARGDVAPNITNLESQVNTLLANQKEFLVKLDRLASEKDETSEQLNTATLRYLKAERKLDRAKSIQVQKLEQQAMASATARPSGADASNGESGESNGNAQALKLALEEAKIEATKQKEQLDAVQAQNKTIQEELTNLQIKLTNLTDEDYSRTDLFKLLKNQHEELVKKVNHLDTENKKLQEVSHKLKVERETYKKKLEDEAQTLTTELEDQLQQSDTALARVRSARDELHGEVQMLKSQRDQERQAANHLKELIAANQDRIVAMESELSRLQPSEDVDMTPRPDLDEMSLEDLREKYKKTEKDFKSINDELPAMTAAVKKYQALATKKIMDFEALEERLAMAIAEKAKANQKYFDARKNTDIHMEEIKRLRAQNNKSSDIISQLKENEAQHRTLLGNMEKQLVDLKQTNTAIMTESKRLESSSNEALRRYDALKNQVNELSSLAKSKDSTASQAKDRLAVLETENEKMKLRVDHMSKDRDKWKVKSMSNSSAEEDMLRQLATCSVCQNRFKNTVLTKCGHIFCKECTEDRLTNRMRKCPNCARAFDRSDVMTVHL
ncbi:hypothetical protein PG999_006930 [Apiospora kogelbergensis]|uniref:E3 ubiquitin protein ligase n=1 Tax=Apiospora kogelbergensis TaxID=1337665 RepID=A0AAW0QWW7_9PEZI